MTRKYEVKRADRAAVPLQVGQIIYGSGYDSYGLKNEDTRNFGIEYESFSLNESGKPVFTMPLEDVVTVTKPSARINCGHDPKFVMNGKCIYFDSWHGHCGHVCFAQPEPTTTPLTDAELDDLAESLTKISPLPWKHKCRGSDTNPQHVIDYDYMIDAANLTPRLIESVKEQAELIAELKEALTELTYCDLSAHPNARLKATRRATAILAKVESDGGEKL